MFESVTINGKYGKFTVIINSEQVKCKKCGQLIIWAVTQKSKNMAIRKIDTNQWICHFDECTPIRSEDKAFREAMEDIFERQRLLRDK